MSIKTPFFDGLAFSILLLVVFLVPAPLLAAPPGSGGSLYQEQCAECHHPKRIGRTAPPLGPRFFSRSAKKRLAEIIRDGLPASAMPGFGEILTPEEIAAVTTFIETPIDDAAIAWSLEEIGQSRTEPKEKPQRKPGAKKYDPENVTLVMERGTKSLVVFEGDELKRTGQFFVGAVHGGPKFSHALDRVYSVARDGLVTVFDIPTLRTLYTLRAGISARSIAVSPSDKVVGVACYLPAQVIFFNDRMEPVHTLPLEGKVGGFYALPGGDRFILSYRERKELLIIDAADFAVEKIPLPAPFEDFSISPVGHIVLGTKRGSDSLHLFDLGLRKTVATIPTSGLPHLASASFWMDGDELLAGINHIKKPVATILSLKDLKVKKVIDLPGAGFFVRTHANTPYLWIDTESEKIALVDKASLAIKEILIPHPGKKAMHVEFTKEGRYALITIPGKEGEVVVYDAVTREKKKTLPFNRPVGKYNATNKTYPGRSLGGQRGDGPVSLGEEVFANYCMGCHHQTIEAFGPPFTEIAAKRSRSQIRFHIADPASSARLLGYRRNTMPRIPLDRERMEAIVAYIMSYKERE